MGKEVWLRSANGDAFAAYVAEPAATPAPGIVILQEAFGINSFVRRTVDRVAQAGFWAIAPDLFWRQVPGVQLDPDLPRDRARAMELLKGFDEKLALDDAAVAAAYLRSLGPRCTARVGALGYCLGGKLAYLAATRPGIDAAVAYYGVGIQSALDQASAIDVPLLLHIAGADHLCPPEAQQKIVKAVEPYRQHVATAIHVGAGHGFARVGAAGFDSTTTERADAMTLEFLNQHLRRS